MPRLDPGPIFTYESMLIARRKATYVARVATSLALFVGLTVVWLSSLPMGGVVEETNSKSLAEVGQSFYLTLVVIELTAVMLVAPALASTSICLDRARGLLAHVMSTPLTSAEVVFGKLAARLLPVGSLIICVAPVLALASLLGGIDPNTVLTAFLVISSVALLLCAATFLLSLRIKKSHEVVMAVYALAFFWWAIVPLLCESLLPSAPGWVLDWNPFKLTTWPYVRMQNGVIDWETVLTFVAACVTAAAVAIGVVAWRLRSAIYPQGARRSRTGWRRVATVPARCVGAGARWIFGRLDGPRRILALDKNPVLWLECRKRGSRVTRLVWGGFWLVVIGFTAYAAVLSSADGIDRAGFETVTFLAVFFGMLLMVAGAAASLADERNRGGLDVLLTTPVATRTVVLAKWLALLRPLPMIAAVVLVATVFIAACATDKAVGWVVRPGTNFAVMTTLGTSSLGRWERWLIAILPPLHVLASGASVAAFGLWIATRIKRVERAVVVAVLIYFVATFGFAVIIEFGLVEWVLELAFDVGNERVSSYHWISNGLMSLSPLGGGMINELTNLPGMNHHERIWVFYAGSIALHASCAAGLLALAIRGFDRRLGRITLRSAPPEPRPRVKRPFLVGRRKPRSATAATTRIG